MPDALPPEILDFLIRTLPSRALWAWLNEKPQAKLQAKVVQGFRATAEVLRQPVARARFVSHLQNSEEDFQMLLKLWAEDSPKILEAVRTQENDETLVAQLPVLQGLYGGEALVLALLHEEREAVLEAWTEIGEEREDIAEASSAELTPNINIATLEKQLQRAQTRVEQFRTKAHDLKTRASQTEKVLQDKLREQEKIARETTREARQATLKVELLESKFAESEKARDRAERKARSIQIEHEESLAESKRLRRQIHRLQQVNEELRRRLNAPAPPVEKIAEAQAEVAQPISGKPPTTRTAKTSSLSPGLHMSPAEFQAAVDRNDEPSVAAFIAELEILREHDAGKATEAVKQIRDLGRYYERILYNPTTRVLVDASNVARHNGPGKGKMEYLRAMREELRRYDFFPILFIADASLPYHIDAPDEFRRMMKTGEIFVSASGQEADEILARQARETGAYVVTNDRNFHRHLAPTFVPSRIGFQIFDNVVVLEDF